MRTRHVLLLAVLFALLSAPVGAQTTGTMPVTMNTTLMQAHQGSIVIAADFVRLDCAGHTVSGDRTGNGIEVVGRQAVTVENCQVTNFSDGFHIVNTQRSVFRNNRAFLNTDEGFSIENSDGNLFIGNTSGGDPTLGNGGDGFDLDNSHENFFFDNTATWNGFPACTHREGEPPPNCNGIEMDFSNNNVFEQNTASNNQNHGFSIDASDANTFSRNTANNNATDGFQIEAFSSSNTFFANRATGNSSDDVDLQDEEEAGFCNVFVANRFDNPEGLELACINRPD